MPEETFVGRKDHLDRFRDLLHSPSGSSYILNLRGPGGSGKTKILQEYLQICIDEKTPIQILLISMYPR